MDYYSKDNIFRVYQNKADAIVSLQCITSMSPQYSERISKLFLNMLEYLDKAEYYTEETNKDYVRALISEVENWRKLSCNFLTI